MSGKTAFQKIVDKHLVRTLSGGLMELLLDRIWCHEITTPPAIIDMQAGGYDFVFDPNKIKVMIDHVNPSKDTATAIQGQIVRNWSRKHGFEFLDVGRNGVCHAIIPEKGWIMPGEIGIMGDSHTCTHGAFCAFTAGVGTTEIKNGLLTGLWICPPQKVIRVNFVGKLPVNVGAKDLILTLINKIGVNGATNAVLEFGGEVIDAMTMEGRMTITNMAVEAGATSGMMMVDKETIRYLYLALKGIYNSPEQALDVLSFFNSDDDAVYDQIVEIDVSDMEPVITIGTSPGDVVLVSSLAGSPINQVYIGSCTNGRIDDLRRATGIFLALGQNVNPNIRCIVVPATQEIYNQAMAEGLLRVLTEAGCFISGPGCGACLGMSNGVLAPGEVCVSTTNRNFTGRMGKGGIVHLVSPETAAVSAIYGEIRSPSKSLCVQVQQGMCHFSPAVCKPTGWKDLKANGFSVPDYEKLLKNFHVKTENNFSGKVFYLNKKNVDTDQIIPAKYLTAIDKSVFGEHLLEDTRLLAEDYLKLHQSQIVVGGENFGCGSSREHAPWAFEAAGIKCIIAPSFARIFENNMFGNGLLCITLPKEDVDFLFAQQPEVLIVDLQKRLVCFGAKEIEFELSEYQRELIRAGGSTGFMISQAAKLQEKEKETV